MHLSREDFEKTVVYVAKEFIKHSMAKFDNKELIKGPDELLRDFADLIQKEIDQGMNEELN